ncbi:MAG: DUF3311 domain-containing protein [Candidatus Omnitrophica bacterium COP1]|nr:DUF3311 domain-containing protein [Candidatus Omnitrophica bacterium COP1]
MNHPPPAPKNSGHASHWYLLVLIPVMVILHQDFWLWTRPALVFGFLPVGLAYHIGYSILASVVMWLLVKLAWPAHLEQFEEDHPVPAEVDAAR